MTSALARAAYLDAVEPPPAEMIAPAWPICLPAGAVWPAMKAITGFGIAALQVLGGLFLAGAADLANHDDDFGLVILGELLQHVDEIHAADGIAADSHAGGLPDAHSRERGPDVVD